MRELILVDERDVCIGYAEKDACHVMPAKRHRAFSIFIINKKGEMLIHKRSVYKKTWPGFWTNACCSHPVKGETIEDAARKRLMEEMGFDCELKYLFTFTYEADYNGIYGESETDHVFLGIYDGRISPDIMEVESYKYVNIDDLMEDIKDSHSRYTPWFTIAIKGVFDFVKEDLEKGLKL